MAWIKVYIDPGFILLNIGDDNVNISCAMLSNMLNISWMTEEYVDRLYIDYTCMTSGLELVIT